jgi:hypothetical protein
MSDVFCSRYTEAQCEAYMGAIGPTLDPTEYTQIWTIV